MTDFNHLSAAEAARRIAAGKLTSEALVAACLERIKARDPHVQAWIHYDPEGALAQARAIDKAGARGRLAGVPVGFKDVIDTADMPTQYNSPIYRDHRPRTDAACVALVRHAGQEACPGVLKSGAGIQKAVSPPMWAGIISKPQDATMQTLCHVSAAMPTQSRADYDGNR